VRTSQADSSNVTNSKQTLQTALAGMFQASAGLANEPPREGRFAGKSSTLSPSPVTGAEWPVPESNEARSEERAS
jgi:hypothetical protein